MVNFKHLCKRCRKNYVVVGYRDRYPLCYDCQKSALQGEIKGKFKKLFDIPEELYKENLFLRNIKIYYLKYGELSDKQVEAFKKTIKKMKE